YKIYWYGNRDIFVDRVMVYDERGRRVFQNPVIRNMLQQEVQEAWVDTSFVYRWYLQNEPNSIDRFGVYREIDSLISNVEQSDKRRPGMACMYRPNLRDEFAHFADPAEFLQNWYPFSPLRDTATFESGSPCVWYSADTLSLQCAWLSMSSHFDKTKRVALEAGKDFWVQTQAFDGYDEDTVHVWRRLTPNELACNVYLALAYGADGIVHFLYYGSGCRTSGADSCLGLLPRHSCDDTTARDTTDQWRMLKEKSDRIRKLGDCTHELDWLGAGLNTDTDTIGGCFIDSLKSDKYASDTAYIHLAFFEDDADTDYVMLINRRCLSTEEQNVTVYMDSAEIGNKKMWYVIDQYSQDTTFTGAIDGEIPFTTHLDPGEGKLFKLAPFPDSAFHGTAQPLTWQGGIMVDGDVTVDSGHTLLILPPGEITFYADTDVVGTGDPTDCDLIVKGGLRAIGNEIDSIIFTSTEKNPNDWEGIQVSDSATSNAVLSYCVVQYAYTGIDLLGPYPDSITHSSFRNNRMRGIRWQNDTDGIISHNCVFSDTTYHMDSYGIELHRIRTGMSSNSVAQNVITNYRDGLWIDDCSTKVSCNSISNAQYRGVCVGEQWLTSFPSYVILDNIYVTGNLDDFGFYTYGNSGFLELEHCRLLPNEDSGPSIGVIFQNNAVGPNPYSMRRCEITDFTEQGVFCHGQALPDLGTTDDKGHNKVYSDVDSAWYVYRSSKSLSPVSAQYNWWGEYPPESSRFYGNVIFMPADSVEWEDPDSLQLKQAVSGQAPKRFELVQNYPNPFNPVTSIRFTIGSHQSPTHTALKIYNILGQLVRTLVNEEKAEGSYTLYWDGRNQNGEQVSSGIYFYRLETGEFTDVKKMLLLR
ncbi:MAG: right-handed parallel beta-helix repeat-containing protein, partial [Desulfobacteraceae bacterium]|nr:right-handed parallel beta-helix repeat-containing protein [Desulfobacteraceae bacterium]